MSKYNSSDIVLWLVGILAVLLLLVLIWRRCSGRKNVGQEQSELGPTTERRHRISSGPQMIEAFPPPYTLESTYTQESVEGVEDEAPPSYIDIV